MRLTKKVIDQILSMNDGFERTTSYSAKNFRASWTYKIKDGVLYIREAGKTSWADSRFDHLNIADLDQTRRFIRNFLRDLRTDGLD